MAKKLRYFKYLKGWLEHPQRYYAVDNWNGFSPEYVRNWFKKKRGVR